MPFGIPSEQIVDAEVVGSYEAPRVQVFKRDPARDVIQIQVPTPSELAVIEQQARAISLFAKIPFFAFVALNGRVPTLLRLGAAVLGALEVAQLAREHGYDYTQQETW